MMPTLPVSESLKEELTLLKPRGVSWDQLLRWILAERPLAEWRDRVDRRKRREEALVETRMLVRRDARSVTRHPDEQVTLAEVARERWKLWRETGRVEEVAPRRLRWNVLEDDNEEGATRVRVRRLRTRS